MLKALQQQERDFLRLQRQRLSAVDFEPLTIIGRGAFGEVCLSERFPFDHRRYFSGSANKKLGY